MRHWVWVFGEIKGLRWVLEDETMAFPDHAGAKVRSMSKGDEAIIYTTRGAFHNPTRDVARLGGIIEVAGEASDRKAVEIAGREFTWTVPIRVETILPERTGPEVKPLAPKLSIVKKPEVWGQYFRSSPIEVNESDFIVMEQAIRSWVSELRRTR